MERVLFDFSGKIDAHAFLLGVGLRVGALVLIYSLPQLLSGISLSRETGTALVEPLLAFGLVIPFLIVAIALSLASPIVRRLRAVGIPVAFVIFVMMFLHTGFQSLAMTNRELLTMMSATLGVQCLIFLCALPEDDPAEKARRYTLLEWSAFAVTLLLLPGLSIRPLAYVTGQSPLTTDLLFGYVRIVRPILIVAFPTLLALIVLQRRGILPPSRPTALADEPKPAQPPTPPPPSPLGQRPVATPRPAFGRRT